MKKRLVSLIIASLVISTATPAFAAETTEATVIADTQDSKDEAVSEEADTGEDTDVAVKESGDTNDEAATSNNSESEDVISDSNEESADMEDTLTYDHEVDKYDKVDEDSECSESDDGKHQWDEWEEYQYAYLEPCSPKYIKFCKLCKAFTFSEEQHTWGEWQLYSDITDWHGDEDYQYDYRNCAVNKYYRWCTVCDQIDWKGGEHGDYTTVSYLEHGASQYHGGCYVHNYICNECEYPVKDSTYTYYGYIKNIILSKTKYAYNGKSHKPSVTVKDSDGKTISSKNYTVKYSSGCTKIGTYTVKVTFKGEFYSGTMKTTFSVVPGKTSLSKLTSTKNSITAKWKKKTSQVTGYQIQYSTNKDFSSTKTISVSKNSSTKKISKLKQGTTYYVRVRTYKKTNGKKYYSSWSAAKSKKTQGKKVLVLGKVKMTSVKADSAIQVTLSWTKASNAIFYRIYYKKDNATKWTKLTDRSGDQTSFVLYDDLTATGPFFGTLEAEHSYTFTVRAYNRSSKKWGEYDTKGLTVTLPPYTQLTETEDTVTVNGVTFDMDDFPEKAILDDDNNMEVLSVAPMSTIDPADITYTINNENAQVVSTPDDADHHYMAEVNEYEYYVSGWKNAIAYIDTYYDAEMYMQYRVEVYNALQTGSFPVSVYYKGTLIRTCQVNVTTTDSRIVKARKWIDKIEQNAWTDDMTDGWDKLIAVKDYIYNNYTYNECTCLGGAEALLWAARDLGYEARYRYVGEKYDYSKGYGDSYYFFPQGLNSHICTIVTMEGEDIIWETQGRK